MDRAAADNAERERQEREENEAEFNSLKAGFDNQIGDLKSKESSALAALDAADKALTAAEDTRTKQAIEAARERKRISRS